jgi:cytochrome c-type biogenesis protein CcmE
VTRKRRRLYLLGLFLLGLGTATALALAAFRDNLVFFYSPSDLARLAVPGDRAVRIGGLVEQGSVERRAGSIEIRFRVTDLQNTLAVVYAGILPDLFREGQGIVAQGRLGPDGVFRASEVLAKHDENYMPPEVAAALKRSGHWQETTGKPK